MSFTSTAASPASAGAAVSVRDGATVIDGNTVIDGVISTSHNLYVEGRITGTIKCDGVLDVALGAEVDATVDAAAIIVSGTLSGEITCHGRLEILATGVVRGNVETGRLIVVEGAVYEGQLRMEPTEADTDEEPEPNVEEEPLEPIQSNQPSGSYSFLRTFTPTTPSTRSGDDVLPASSEEEEPE